MLLVAQLRHELHLDFAAVQVPGEIEHVSFQQHLAAAFNSGARSETCNAAQRTGRHAMHEDSEDPGHRHTPPAGSEIRGWETQLAPELVAPDHTSRHRIRTPEPRAR